MTRVRFLMRKRWPHPDGPKRQAGEEHVLSPDLAELWHARGVVQIVDPPEAPLDGLTVRELRELATERGIDLGTATRKADIINALTD